MFNGEKLVLYGLLKGAGKDKIGQCSAVLKGKMLGSDVEHCINFQLEGGSLSSDMPIVHQLAAKSLIQDWENEKDSKKADIIKLSVESSVVSSHTSYIAIDEEQDKPIEGAIKTYDLTADTVPSYYGGGGRGGGISCCSRHRCCCSACCCARPAPQMMCSCTSSMAPKKKSAGLTKGCSLYPSYLYVFITIVSKNSKSRSRKQQEVECVF